MSAFKSPATTGLVDGLKCGDNEIYVVNNVMLGMLGLLNQHSCVL
jgi:hypothetical protein